MAISHETIKIQFNIGSFNHETSLNIPEANTADKFFLHLEDNLSAQIDDWDDGVNQIYIISKITFEGDLLYKHPNFDDETFSVLPPDPDIKLAVDYGVPDVILEQSLFPVIKGMDGEVVSGKYRYDFKIIYMSLGGVLTPIAGFRVAEFAFDKKKPKLEWWYDEAVPLLSIQDTQSYVIDGKTAKVNSEFTLYPPQNRTPIIKAYANSQRAIYDYFWTGSNEVSYKALLTYVYSDFVVNNFVSEYSSMDVYRIDWCMLNECISKKEGKEALKTSCGTKKTSANNDELLKITSLVQRIQISLGCGKSDLKDLIEELNDTLDCGCSYLDSTPVFLKSSNVKSEDVQIIDTFDVNTPVDLKKGHFIFVNIDVGGNTTEISIDNIVKYSEYTFLFKNVSQEQVMTATFTAQFQDSSGVLAPINVSNGNTVVAKFFSPNDDVLQLMSLSFLPAIGISGVQGTAGEINVNNANPLVPKLSLSNTIVNSLQKADTAVQSVGGTANQIVVNASTPTAPVLSFHSSVIDLLNVVADIPPFPDDGGTYMLTENDAILSWVTIPSGGGDVFQTVSGVSGGTTAIDFSNGNNVFVPFANTDITITTANVIEGGVYRIVIRNGGASQKTVTCYDFFWSETKSMASAEVWGMTLLAVKINPSTMILVPTGEFTE